MRKLCFGVIVLCIAALFVLPFIVLYGPLFDKIESALAVSSRSITKADLLGYYNGLLAIISTASLGIIAFRQSAKANKLSRELAQIQKDAKKPIVAIDFTHNLIAHYNNNDAVFNDFFSSSDVVFEAYKTKVYGFGQSDLTLFKFYVINVSDVYIKELRITKIKLKYDMCKRNKMICDCESCGMVIIAPNQSKSAMVIVDGIKTHFPEIRTATQGGFPEIDMYMTAVSIYGKASNMHLALYAMNSSTDDQNQTIAYKMAYNDIEISKEYVFRKKR